MSPGPLSSLVNNLFFKLVFLQAVWGEGAICFLLAPQPDWTHMLSIDAWKLSSFPEATQYGARGCHMGGQGVAEEV